MALYAYRAMDTTGKVVSGQLDARDETELGRRLERLGLELTRAREIRPNRWLGRRRVTRKDLINFSVHMEQLLRAGIPVMEGLEDIRNSTENPMFRGVIAALLAEIEGGRPLSAALAAHPEAFDKIYVALVRAGEESGRLDEVFREIAQALKWQDEIVSQTRRALLYPSFVMVVVLAVMSFMMIYLVPRLTGFLTGLGHEVPIQTRLLIAVSDAFVNYWYLLVGVPVGLVLIYRWFHRVSPSFAVAADRWKLRVPVVGPILEKIALGRLANYFALLYSAGVGVLESLALCQDVMGNAHLREGLVAARQRLTEGATLSDAFAQAKIFPVLVVRMLKVGESTGALDEALLNAAYFYERDVRESIERMQTLIEPTLTVILGILLGWVMLSVLAPIYENLSKLMV